MWLVTWGWNLMCRIVSLMRGPSLAEGVVVGWSLRAICRGGRMVKGGRGWLGELISVRRGPYSVERRDCEVGVWGV